MVFVFDYNPGMVYVGFNVAVDRMVAHGSSKREEKGWLSLVKDNPLFTTLFKGATGELMRLELGKPPHYNPGQSGGSGCLMFCPNHTRR